MTAFLYRLFIVISGMAISVISCNTSNSNQINVYESDALKIHKISDQVYVHVTFLDIPNYGAYPCNGLIYTSGNEAIIFDSPSADSVAMELIDFVQQDMKAKIKAVVINHFHEDCLGSLKVFHENNIPSYCSTKTIEFAKQDSVLYPKLGFDHSHSLFLGDKEVINTFPGEAHTLDNIVSYLVEEKVLFGGCMVKALGAKKGNTKDANVRKWPTTIQNLKATFPETKIVIPGHGQWGNMELLDYTIELFSKDEIQYNKN